ncbi:MAG: HlyC/CorC family transporter [Anaerolineales bacterium]|nr:HlyC/CorC family transporter [Anaerolineales bacterium]MCA9930031.1 HlyC/CorC family transporter [Anaerolineales bacterium]
MATIFLIVASVVILIGLNGLYVAAEFSAVAARRTKVSQMAGDGNRFAQMLQPILESTAQKDKYLAATQLGITISSLVLGAYGQNEVAVQLVPSLSRLITDIEPFLSSIGIEATETMAETAATSIAVTGVLILFTILQVIMGELFPKSLAIQYPEEVAVVLLIPMKISLFLLRPFIWFFNGSGIVLLRLIPWANKGSSKGHSPEEIEILVTESHEGGLLDDRARQMLRNAFRLRDLSARQVMVHRTKMLSAPLDTPIIDLIKMAIDAGYSRIPLYAESIDDIKGFVHVKDLFRRHVQNRSEIETIMREVMYVPETMPVLDVWEKLNRCRMYVAIVFDEFGGTVGMITFEDLIEEIFGELQDEFDDEMALVSRDKEGRIHLRGDLLVSDVNEYLELNLPQETADTLSGLIFSETGGSPNIGDEVIIGETVLRVESMEDLGVQEISIKLAPSSTVAPYSEWEVTDYDE